MNSICKNKILFISFVFLAFFSLRVFADEPKDEADPSKITIDFVDANIADVVRVLATANDLNYVIGDEVTGKVTIKLKNVSFETAMDAVVAANGYGYKIVENVLYVNTMEKLREQEKIKQMINERQELITFVFQLKYINADDVIPILKNELSDRGKIFSLKRTVLGGYKGGQLSVSTTGMSSSQRSATTKEESTRTLVVIDVPYRIEKIKRLLEKLDKMAEQVLIDTKIVELQMDSSYDFGIKWNFLGGGADGTGGLTIGPSNISKQITNTLTRTTNYDDKRELTPKSDVEMEMPYSIKSHIMDYDAEELNANSNVYDSTDTNKENPLSSFNVAHDKSIEFVRNLEQSEIKTATLSVSDFNLVLNALKATGNVEIISNPTILTLNNHEASILIGERYPIIQTETSDVGYTTESLDHYEPIGVHLQVIPQVLDKDYISMIIRPAVTSLGGVVQGNNISINRINTREASTQAIVRSGETVVIGGLISNRLTKNISKLPLFGDIPILGWAFKNKRDVVEKVNLMVFVTPTVVKNE